MLPGSEAGFSSGSAVLRDGLLELSGLLAPVIPELPDTDLRLLPAVDADPFDGCRSCVGLVVPPAPTVTPGDNH